MMARIPLTEGFVLIPEGTYVFRIYDATYDEDFGKILIKMVTASGMTYTERFSIKDANDEYNERAMNAFSYFAKTAMNDFNLEDIEPEELIDRYIRAEIIHAESESTRTPGKMLTFANLGDKEPAECFDENPTEKAMTLGKKSGGESTVKAEKPAQKAATKSTGGLNLDDLLG